MSIVHGPCTDSPRLSDEVFAFRIDEHPSPASGGVRAEALSRPEFGRQFTDHMALVDWSAERGWRDPHAVLAAGLWIVDLGRRRSLRPGGDATGPARAKVTVTRGGAVT